MEPRNVTKAPSALAAPGPGMGPVPSIGGLVAAVAGIVASAELLMSEMRLLADPAALLTCDVNPLIGCSKSLMDDQSHLLGDIPNSLIGLIVFGALAALFAVALFGGRWPRLVWWGLLAGTAAGVGMVVFFLSSSLFGFRILCPYCLVVWAGTLMATVIVWTQASARGVLGKRLESHAPARLWWLITLALYLLVVLLVVLVLRDKIALIL